MTNNPILERFRSDRQRALDAKDPMAALLALATVAADGAPEVRTLVLREVEGQLALFLNQSSPKWRALQEQGRLQFMTYWPSSQLQYRFDCQFSLIDKTLVDDSWRLRPESPRRLDHVYENGATQSSAVADRSQLLERAASVDPEHLTTPPTGAIGLYLEPTRIERLDLNMDGAPHARQRYRAEHQWAPETLIP